jgi:hypothetical protein
VIASILTCSSLAASEVPPQAAQGRDFDVSFFGSFFMETSLLVPMRIELHDARQRVRANVPVYVDETALGGAVSILERGEIPRRPVDPSALQQKTNLKAKLILFRLRQGFQGDE